MGGARDSTLHRPNLSILTVPYKIESAIPWLQLAGFSAMVVNNGLQAAITLKQLGKAGKAD